MEVRATITTPTFATPRSDRSRKRTHARVSALVRSPIKLPSALVLWLTLAFVVIYAALDLNALYALRGTQNTGLFLQTLVNFFHTGSPVNNVDYSNHFAWHDQWTVLLLAPLVAAFPRPETLMLLQVVFVALGAIALYALASDAGAKPSIAGAVAIAYLISPSMQGAAYEAFAPEKMLPPLAFGLILAARHRAIVPVVILTCLILGVKEDEAFFLAWFGLATLIWYDRRIGVILIGLSVVSWLGYHLFLHIAGLQYRMYPFVLDLSDWPHMLAFLVEILVPTGFAALGYRWIALVLALPLLAEVFLFRIPATLYRAGDYHTIPLVICAFAALALISGTQPNFARFALIGSSIMALFFNVTPLHFGRTLVYARDPEYAAARSWATTNLPVDFPCEDVGAYTVAAANPNARLVHCDQPLSRERPAWKNVPLDSHAAWTQGALP